MGQQSVFQTFIDEHTFRQSFDLFVLSHSSNMVFGENASTRCESKRLCGAGIGSSVYPDEVTLGHDWNPNHNTKRAAEEVEEEEMESDAWV